jgi:DNA-binding CsgD family transcriptional regulator
MNTDRWNTGVALMQSADPQVRNTMAEDYDLISGNATTAKAVEACEEESTKTNAPLPDTITVLRHSQNHVQNRCWSDTDDKGGDVDGDPTRRMNSPFPDRIGALWDELADANAAQTNEALNRLMRGLCELVGAQNATWIGAVRMDDALPADPVRGWRPRLIRHLYPNQPFDAAAREQARDLETGYVDVSTVRNVSFAGRFRTHLLAELVPASWFEGDYYRVYYAGLNHHDAIWAGVPISEDAESYFGLYRGAGQERFTGADRDAVGHALRALRWFLRQHMLGEGLLVAAAPLTPVERAVLQGLLTGVPEKQIAQRLGRSYHTTHEYVIRIFRKYGVTNRTTLMALWLGHAVPPD